MVKLSPKGLLVAAGAFSFLTMILLYVFLQDDTAPTVGVTQKVVVAAKDIAERTKVAESDVKVVEVSKELVQEGAISDPKAVIGVITKLPILAGDQLRDKNLALLPGEKGLAGVIPSDRRAVTIAINSISGVEGFVRPGDYVDVIAAMPAGEGNNVISQVILQDIEVLAIGKNDKTAAPPDAAKENVQTATLAVTLDEAERLVLFKGDGMLSLALRPFEVKGRSIVIGRDLVDVMGRGILAGKAVAPAPAPIQRQSAYVPTAVEPARPSQASPAPSSGGIAVYRGVEKEVVHPVR